FLILLGVFLILGKGKFEPGIILIGLGSVLILEDLNILEWRNMWQIFWPVIIIVIGVSLIVRRNFRPAEVDQKKNDINYIDEYILFGGREMKIDSSEFQGGKITS